jgi:hypothetical protein
VSAKDSPPAPPPASNGENEFKSNQPTAFELSKAATKKAVLSETLQHPVTLCSTGVGILGGVAVGLFGISLLPVGACLGGLGVGVGSWAFNYFVRGRSFADAYVKDIQERLASQRNTIVTELASALETLSANPGHDTPEIPEYAEQANRQFGSVQQRFTSVHSTLNHKLNPGELTFSRYLTAAEQVYLAVLDNLVILVQVLQGLVPIDRSYTRERFEALRKLAKDNDLDEADQREFDTLKEREELVIEQLDRVNTLLTQNEEAITEMDRLNLVLASTRIRRGQAASDLDSAIREMEDLARRVHHYQA